MAEELVKKLRPRVSIFSGAIKNNHVHGDYVCLGGKVTSIIDISRMAETTDKNRTDIVQIDIDDGVGNISLLLLTEIYDRLMSEELITVNDVILAKGKVYDPMKKLKKDKNDWPSVLCWSIEKFDK